MSSFLFVVDIPPSFFAGGLELGISRDDTGLIVENACDYRRGVRPNLSDEEFGSSVKIAFIGDIHGYAPALEEALEMCRGEGVESIVGLGDYIDGYDRNEDCVALVRKHFGAAVWGNHDENHGSELSFRAEEWLGQLPQSLEWEGWLVTHSSPRKHRQGEYIRSPIEAWSCFDDCAFQRCVVGHAHRPKLYRFEEGRVADCEALDANGEGQVLDLESRYIFVNPSLAYNRSGDPRPGFSIFDSDTQRLRIIYLNRPPIIDSY